MQCLRKLLAFCVFALSVAGINSAVAADAPAVDRSLKGDAVCTKCHNESWDKPILALYQTRMGVKGDPRTPGCQSCHGASAGHLQNPGNAPDVVFGAKSKNVSAAAARNEVCLSCHKAGKRANWDGSAHESRGLACTNCHEVHSPEQRVLNKVTQPDVCFACHKEQRAQIHKLSHHPIEEGKVACSDCHNPHGTEGSTKLLVKNSVNETCYTCHAEKRGPFLWQHSPVVDDCTNCHTPHGASYGPLLKVRLPQLCQQCHQDHGNSLKGTTGTIANGPGNPAGNTVASAATFGKFLSVQAQAKGCVNCHVMVHGSNAPNGAKFNR
jgi:DmsE family decaheme c-type cytochrome